MQLTHAALIIPVTFIEDYEATRGREDCNMALWCCAYYCKRSILHCNE